MRESEVSVIHASDPWTLHNHQAPPSISLQARVLGETCAFSSVSLGNTCSLMKNSHLGRALPNVMVHNIY